MRRFLKKYERFLSIHHYVAVLRRQPAHMQHVYAALFAGIITSLLAAFILYVDYGFWHEKYHRTDDTLVMIEVSSSIEKETITIQSPVDMLGDFLNEAGGKLHAITTSKPDFLDNTETYSSGE